MLSHFRRNTLSSPFFLLTTTFLFFISCEKKTSESSNTNPKLTEEILTKHNSAERVWILFLYEEKYFSAAGAVDSNIVRGPIFNFQTDRHEIRFIIGPDVTTGQTNAKTTNLYTDNLLERLFPGIGNWELNNSANTINIVKHPRFNDGGDGGQFSFEYRENVPLPFPYPKSLGLKITKYLPNNRKMEAAIIFGSY